MKHFNLILVDVATTGFIFYSFYSNNEVLITTALGLMWVIALGTLALIKLPVVDEDKTEVWSSPGYYFPGLLMDIPVIVLVVSAEAYITALAYVLGMIVIARYMYCVNRG